MFSMVRRARSPRAARTAIAPLVLLALGLTATGARAQEAEEAAPAAPPAARQEESAPRKAIFQVQRIELALFGGPFAGATYLELPDIQDIDRTRDLGATEILDFSGRPLRSADNEEIRAPRKELDGSIIVGGSATFFLGDRFGLSLRAAYGKTEATVTGFTDGDRERTPAGQATERYEWDRSDASIVQGGSSMVYHIGKSKLRPWVTLGFGGILNSYPETDDVAALYFLYGGGLRYPISKQLVAQIGIESTLYSYDNDEILYDETITLPMITLGVSWRHDVPPPPAAPAEEPAGS